MSPFVLGGIRLDQERSYPGELGNGFAPGGFPPGLRELELAG